jgi:hypothetical protein
MKTKHKHYQAIRAFADGWKIEKQSQLNNWYGIALPLFSNDGNFRIVPDEDGWLPWYGGECPVSHDTEVEVKLYKGYDSGYANSLYWGSALEDNPIIYYRVIKQEENPTTKKVKLWQWVMKTDEGYVLTDGFYASKEHTMSYCLKVIQPALWTEIEVEE